MSGREIETLVQHNMNAIDDSTTSALAIGKSMNEAELECKQKNKPFSDIIEILI